MAHSVHDQLRFLNQWFRTWSEYQKDDFLHVLASKLSPKSSIITAEVNGIVNGMQGMSTSGRPPSLFACQVLPYITSYTATAPVSYLILTLISD